MQQAHVAVPKHFFQLFEGKRPVAFSLPGNEIRFDRGHVNRLVGLGLKL